MKKVVLPLLAVFILTLTGCEVGMGEALDLEAPELTISSPGKFTYQPLEFDLKGTCKDNIAVNSVTISNKETGRVYGNARITGENWEFHVNLSSEEEGEITFLCEANDRLKNTSTRSARTITLLVDENAPVGKDWYTDRGNSVQTQLQDKDFLEDLDFTLSVNKDYPQNQEFTLYGSFYDAMSINTITVKLFEDTKSTTIPIAEKTVNASDSSAFYIGDGKSIYSPSFKFTQSDLVNGSEGGSGNSACSSGKHYLRVEYYAKDNDDPVNFNEDTRDTGKYILWYPESDKPGIQQTQVKDGKIRASVGSSIPVDFFDDDGLKEIYCALKKTITGTCEAYAQSLITNPSLRSTVFGSSTSEEPVVSKTGFADNYRDYPETIVAPDVPLQMYLVCAAKDMNGKWNARVIEAEIVDSAKPMLFIESPVENSTPTMESSSENEFKFKGYSLDTKGSSYVKIAYIPNKANLDREERAKTLFEQNKNDTSAKKTISGTNEVIWYKAITGTNKVGEWNKQEFEITMNLFTDFKTSAGASAAKDEKFFEILLVDTDGNEVTKPFILSGDNLPPSIDIKEPDTELKVHDYTVSDLVIKFKGEKANGIAMKPELYKITTKIGNEEKVFTTSSTPKISTPDANGYVTLTIPKATLTTWAKDETQPTFTFYATDKLDNGGLGEDMRSVILSPRPTISSITVDKNHDTTYKAGSVFKFKVSFTREVKVSGTPKLKLSNISVKKPGVAVDNSIQYATYESGSGTNSLTFTWTVPDYAESDKIVCQGLYTAKDVNSSETDVDKLADGATIRATELGEGGIYTTLSKAEVLKYKKDSNTTIDKVVKLDGIFPVVTAISVTSGDGNSYCTVDKKINAVLTMSEPVLFSTSPTLLLYVGSSPVNFTFEKIDTAENKLYFVHSVKNTDPQGELRYALASCFATADLSNLTDNVENTIKLTNNTNGPSGVYIDYTPPAAAPTINLSATTYNEAKELELIGIDDGATGYYSTDGVSFTEYDSANKEELGDGTYSIVTYQEDAAGNRSPNSTPVAVKINSKFASVTNFSIELADGSYGAGEEVNFTLNFESKVVIKAASDITLKFQNKAGTVTSDPINVNVPATIPSGGYKTNAVSFTYTVDQTDDYKGIKVSEITFVSTFKDEDGNSPAFATTPKVLTPSNNSYLAAADGGKRDDIILDGVAPTITTYTPAMNGSVSGVASMTDNSSGKFKITLRFSENVFAEAGTIILQRKGNWYIPAVFTVDEFNKYYNQMSAANKAKMLRLGTDGYELLHTRTGIAVGPYRKITHGLKIANGKYVPDTETKYVLAYELGVDSGTAALDNGNGGTFTASVADIRDALESVGYHQHKVDVASSYVKVTGDTVEITFQEAIEDGREWELIIPDTAFRDNSENFYKGMNITGATDNYSLWSNNVAQPVVRVDRYTHGWGAHEPKANGTFTDVTVNNGKYKTTIKDNSSAAIAPTGYCRVRIDCETPGAAIKYSKVFNNGTVYTDTPPAGAAYDGGSENDNTTYHTNKRNTPADITKANLEKLGASTYTQGNDIIIGDGSYTTARKDYITAYATKTGFNASENGYEGIFKTIVYIKSGQAVACLNIEGGTAAGGQPSVNGFPLKDATDEDDPNGAGRYSKNCYVIPNGDGTQDRKNFVFVSYEIISNNWAILLCGTNHSRDYPLNSYGGAAYITKQNFWSGTNVQ